MAACLPDIIQKGKADMQKNTYNITGLEAVIKRSEKTAKELGRLPGSFSETLKIMMKERKITRTRLAIEINVAESTVSRIRNNDDYCVTKQMVIAICVAMKLNPAEAFDLFNKSCCKLVMTNPQDVAYYHILTSCGQYSIDDINEILEAKGFEILGGK